MLYAPENDHHISTGTVGLEASINISNYSSTSLLHSSWVMGKNEEFK